MAAPATTHRVARYPGRGLTLNVHDTRPEGGHGSVVVLLHGFLDAGGTWRAVAEPLAEAGFRVLAPDQRGFGGSDRVGAGGYYHFADYAADLDALFDRLAEEEPDKPLHLVGHSMGGTVASLYAGARPDRVARLALLEGVGPPAMDPTVELARTRQWLDALRRARGPRPVASIEAAVERLAQNHTAVDRAVLREVATHLTRDDGAGGRVWAEDPLHRTPSPRAFRADTFRVFLTEIRCPVLFVSGGSGGWHPPDEEERLAAVAAPLTRATLEGAGHMMHWTQPAAVAEVLARFFATVP